MSVLEGIPSSVAQETRKSTLVKLQSQTTARFGFRDDFPDNWIIAAVPCTLDLSQISI